jgi:hypothetical protein
MCRTSLKSDVIRVASLVARRDVVCLWVSIVILVELAREVRTVRAQRSHHVVILEALRHVGVKGAAEGIGPGHLHVRRCEGDGRGQVGNESGTEN